MENTTGKDSRKKIIFFISSSALSLLTGVYSISELLYYNSYLSLLKTTNEMRAIEMSQHYLGWIANSYRFGLALIGLLLLVSSISLLFVMVPSFGFKRNWRYLLHSLFLYGIIVSSYVAALYFIFTRFNLFIDIIQLPPYWIIGIIMTVICMTGWGLSSLLSAYDNSTFNRNEPTSVLKVGALAGFLVFLMFWLGMAAGGIFDNYILFVMPSQVEMSFRKAVSLVVAHGATLLVVSVASAAVLVSLAPGRKMSQDRMKWMNIAVAAFITLGFASLLVYASYYGKTRPLRLPLTEAAGLSTEAPEAWNLLVMGPNGTFLLQKWPQEQNYNNIVRLLQDVGNSNLPSELDATEKFPLTKANLQKLEKFLLRIDMGGRLQWDLEESIMEGYFNMWDIETGRRRMLDYSHRYLYPRLLFQSYSVLSPTTKMNIDLTKEFVNEGKWFIDAPGALWLTRILYCSGLEEEAHEWVQRARSLGETFDPRDFTCSKPLNGKIKGRVLINGAMPTGLKVGLFYHSSTDSTVPEISTFDIMTRCAVQELGATGRFKFTNLRDANYYLVIADTQGALPHRAEAVEVLNNPGFIAINSTSSDIDLGTIAIKIEH